jgi:hypothetical protein
MIIAYINITTSSGGEVPLEVEYLYSPISAHTNRQLMKEWETTTIQQLSQNPKTIYLDQFYWYLITYSCQLVNRDPQWIVVSYPILINFWKEVEHYRKAGVQALTHSPRGAKPPFTPLFVDVVLRGDVVPPLGILRDDSPHFLQKKHKCLL